MVTGGQFSGQRDGVMPDGLGVVEGALALTLTGAGVRHPVALATAA